MNKKGLAEGFLINTRTCCRGEQRNLCGYPLLPGAVNYYFVYYYLKVVQISGLSREH